MVSIPKLTQYSLRYAFKDVKQLTIKDASMLEQYNEFVSFHRSVEEKRQSELKKKEEEERRKRKEEERKKKEEEEKRKREEERKRREKGIVLNAEDFASLSDHLTSITVNACENYQQEILDFSRFKELKTLKIGGNCFNYPSIVSIVDLTHLKHIEIGEYSFQDNSSEAELVVSRCSSLVSLAIGSHSFSHFKVFKMSDLSSLETLEVGADCFREADFKMKNMEAVKTVRLGDTSFQRSRHTVIEGTALDEGVMTRVFESAGGRAGRVLLERREERAL